MVRLLVCVEVFLSLRYVLMGLWLGALFLLPILPLRIHGNLGTINKIFVSLIGMMLWKLNSLLYSLMVLGDWSLLFLVLI
jgi:hypothetical protein